MVSRAFCIPGVFFLFAATVLLIVTSISLPYLPVLDIARVHVNSGDVVVGTDTTQAISELRFGVWAYCADERSSGTRSCSTKGHGYSVTLNGPNNSSTTIKPSWTRGLAVLPVAAAVSFIALLLSFSTHITVTLVSSLVSFLAATLTLIAFAIEIALYAWIKERVKKLNGVGQKTDTAPGFWLTFAAMLLLVLAGMTVCFGRRRASRMSDAGPMSASANGPYQSQVGKRPFWSRFRKNKVV